MKNITRKIGILLSFNTMFQNNSCMPLYPNRGSINAYTILIKLTTAKSTRLAPNKLLILAALSVQNTIHTI